MTFVKARLTPVPFSTSPSRQTLLEGIFSAVIDMQKIQIQMFSERLNSSVCTEICRGKVAHPTVHFLFWQMLWWSLYSHTSGLYCENLIYGIQFSLCGNKKNFYHVVLKPILGGIAVLNCI